MQVKILILIPINIKDDKMIELCRLKCLSFCCTSILHIVLFSNQTFAQSISSSNIVPDSTLGSSSSRVRPLDTAGFAVDLIESGAVRGNNLFHSFREFNVSAGRGAYFLSPNVSIENIFTRVTGNNVSNILGTLGTIGNSRPNLFLINPNGIIFGQNASLDIGGSFIASTASSLNFADGSQFSASAPQNASLLSISIPTGLRFRENAQGIQVQGDGQGARRTSNLIDTTAGLRVGSNKTLALVGGDISLEGATLKTAGGRVELGSVAGESVVSLNPALKGFILNYDGVQNFGNIQLTQQAVVDASGEGAGDIQVTGKRVSVMGGGQIEASTLGTLPGGNVIVNAQELLEVADKTQNNQVSGVYAQVYPNATGNGASLTINTGDLILKNEGLISTDVAGAGNGQNLTINANNLLTQNQGAITAIVTAKGNAGIITINARDINLNFSGIISRSILPQVEGNAGNVSIVADTLKLTNRGLIDTSTSGKGNAGNIIINTKNISTDGGFISSGTQGEAEGNAGNINLTTDFMTSVNQSSLTSSSIGKSNAGDITINARNLVSLDGLSSITVNNPQDQAAGNAGNVNIKAGLLNLTNGANISSGTSGTGNSGNITINADNISLDGGTEQFLTSISTETVSKNSGKGGNIELITGSINITNGASLFSGTNGQGKSGNIIINASDTIKIDGTSKNFFVDNLGQNPIRFSSRIQSSTSLDGTGVSGDISINAKNILLTNGGQIQASSVGQGDSGKIAINSRDTVLIDGFGGESNRIITSSISSDGFKNQAGSIELNTGILTLTNGGKISSSGIEGNGGNININARDAINIDGFVNIFRSSINNGLVRGVGKGGDIQLFTGSLSLTNGATIVTSTAGQGNGGNITINARDSIKISSLNDNLSGIASDVRNNATGNAGNISLTSNSLFLNNTAQVLSSTADKGNAGNITLKVADISLANSSLIRGSVEPGGIGDAGDIDIQGRTLSITSGSVIQSALFGSRGNLPAAQGRGGNIRINTSDYVTISGFGNTLFGTGLITGADLGTSGNAGNIKIDTNQLKVRETGTIAANTLSIGNGGDIALFANTFELLNGGQILTTTANSGKAGTIRINVKDSTTIAGSETARSSGVFASTILGSTGQGGDIFINSRQMRMNDAIGVFVGSAGTGRAGNIFIVGDLMSLDNKTFIAATTNSNQGGNIDLQLSDLLFLRRGSQISTSAGFAQAGGDGGNITINTPFIVAIPNENSDITANAFAGLGGKVTINATGIFGMRPLSREQLARTLGTNDPTQLNPNKLPTNDITAISQQNPSFSGQVLLNTPEVDSTQGIVELSQTVVDPNALIAQNPCLRRAGSEFISTGGGGLPSNPAQTLSDDGVNIDLVEPVISNQPEHNSVQVNQTLNKTQQQIQPAQGWVVNEKGEVLLTAYPTNANVLRDTKSKNLCQNF